MSVIRNLNTPPFVKPAVTAEHRTSGFKVSVPTSPDEYRTVIVYREVVYRDADGLVTEAPPGYSGSYQYTIQVTPEFLAKYPAAAQVMGGLAAIFDAEDQVVNPVS